MPYTDPPDLQALGRFIRRHRHALGLTQTQLAHRVGGRQEQISILEQGTYGMPSLPWLSRLGTALETSLAEVLQAAGYTEMAVAATDPADPPGRHGRSDTVEVSGLSALLAPDRDRRRLDLSVRNDGRIYHAGIHAAGSDWLLTLVDDDKVTLPVMIGDVLASQDRAIVCALLEVLRVNQSGFPLP